MNRRRFPSEYRGSLFPEVAIEINQNVYFIFADDGGSLKIAEFSYIDDTMNGAVDAPPRFTQIIPSIIKGKYLKQIIIMVF